MRRRRRVLFIAEAVTLAHVVRPMVLARSLDPSIYDIHFACAGGYDQFLSDAAFERHEIRSVSSQQFLDKLAKGSPLYDQATLEAYVEEDLRLLEAVTPDLVVGDFRLSLAVSAPLKQIRYATLTNAHWSPYSKRIHAPFPEHPTAKLLGVRVASRLFQLVEPIVFATHAKPLNRIRKKYRLAPLGGLREAYTYADDTLYLDVPELIPTGKLPANHRYLGPVIWSPSLSLPDWWPEIPSNQPCVYVTLGSSGAVDLLPGILGALETLPISVIVATAGRSDIRPAPRKRWTADYLDGEAAAQRSDLVISNGGSASGYQALSVGTPVLGIPHNMDQFFTQEAIVAAGAGALIRPSGFTDELAQETVDRLLDDLAYTSAAGKLAAAFEQYDVRQKFAVFLDEVLG